MSLFNYNRDSNIAGTAATELLPIYGSSVTFQARTLNMNFGDSYKTVLPIGVNNIEANWTFEFGLSENSNAIKILKLLEQMSLGMSHTHSDPSNFYKDQLLKLLSFDHSFEESGINKISASFFSDNQSVSLSWKTNMLKQTGYLSDWASGVYYNKFDVVYRNINTEQKNNFFYCKQSHLSSNLLDTSDDTLWSQEMFWQPNESIQIPQGSRIIKTVMFGSQGFTTRKFSRNNNSVESVQFLFKQKTDAEAKSILHFLFSHEGRSSFIYRFPKTYNEHKKWIATQWTHRFVYKNVNDIEVNLTEDVNAAN